jgi:hypothetical protein
VDCFRLGITADLEEFVVIRNFHLGSLEIGFSLIDRASSVSALSGPVKTYRADSVL